MQKCWSFFDKPSYFTVHEDKRHYYPYMLYVDHEGNIVKHIDDAGGGWDLPFAYEEALRYKEEYETIECGVECHTKDVLKIISWKEGKYYKSKGMFLYKLVV